MRSLSTFSFISNFRLAILLMFTSTSYAQRISDPALLSKNSFEWNQEERELGFLYLDSVFEGREVLHGDKVRELPKGEPIVAFEEGGAKEKAFETFVKEHKVAGVLILHDGKIRLERYALGHSEVGRWTSHSVAKSVTSTLVGAAIKDGYIKSVDDYITDYIPDLKGSAYDKATVHHLLTMSTGVQWIETLTNPNSDLIRFFAEPIEPGINEIVSYMRRLPSEAEPGEKWLYKTGETHLLGVLVSAATGQTLSDYLSEKIWVPYGMEDKATWLFGRTEYELAGCCLQVRLRDFARFGQFVLDGGRINGEAVVPDGWFQTATKPHFKLWGSWGYGYQWWTLEEGTFQALGVHGQVIHVDPARRLVVVINSAWPEPESLMRQAANYNFLKSVAKEIDEE